MQVGEFLLAALGFDQVRDIADPDWGGVRGVVGVLHFAQFQHAKTAGEALQWMRSGGFSGATN
ncbi:hypothetical protein FE36_20395 [Xanthomonas oryzae pv. oryzicola]|nr:hypothetical protein FE36_20395 [Xanthomonas oryzae pv. oryzicola]